MTADEFQTRLRKAMRPSAAERLLGCAAAPSREAAVPGERESSEFAEWGIVAHQVAAACLDTTKPEAEQLPEFYVGQYVDGVAVDYDMARCVQEYLEYLVPYRTGGWSAAEQEVSLAGIFPQAGTADYVFCGDADGVLHVFDFKTGRGVKVYAERNPQLMAYALGVIDDFAPLFDVRAVELHIVQPRINHFDRWPVSLAELEEFRARVVDAVARAQAPDPRATPGKHCRWCAVRATCVENAEHVTQSVGLQFDNLDEVRPAPVSLDAGALSAILDAADDVRAWLKAVEDYAAAEIRAGREVPGYKLVEGRTTRKWISEGEVIALAKKKRLPIDTYAPRSTASVAQLEKTITPKVFNKYGFPLLLTRGEGAPTLAHVSDKRPALSFAAAPEDFDDLTQPAEAPASAPSLDDLLA